MGKWLDEFTTQKPLAHRVALVAARSGGLTPTFLYESDGHERIGSFTELKAGLIQCDLCGKLKTSNIALAPSASICHNCESVGFVFETGKITPKPSLKQLARKVLDERNPGR